MLSTILLFAIRQDAAAAIEKVVAAEMQRQQIPGLSIRVEKDGQVLLRKAYGRANIELDVPATPENVYNAGSITKVFTALTLMSLVEEGKLSLQDKVSQHVAKAPESWKEITVKNLLSHTSGIAEYALVPGLGLTDEYTRETWWEKIGPMALDFTPGTRYAYSNSNYTVLSEVIEKVGGKPYYEAVSERVIAKAGLQHTKFRQTNEIVPGLATGYFKVGNGMIVSPAEASSSAYGAGGIVTTVDDLSQLLDACEQGKIVSASTLELMHTANRTSDGRKTTYGLGWFVRDLSGHPMLSHGGNTAGYSASMAYFPDERLKITLMGNVYAFVGDNLAIMVARAIEPELRPVPLSEKPDPDAEFTKVLAGALGALIEGKTDDPSLDPNYRGLLESPRGRMSLGGFAQYKGHEGLAFLDRKPEEPDVLYIYRTKKGDAKFRVTFTVTKERKVFSVALQREN